MTGPSSIRERHESTRPWGSAFVAFLGILLLCTALFAVTAVWTRTVDGSDSGEDYANGAAIDSNGDLYVVGSIETSTGSDIWIRKYNSAGTKLWTRTVDGPASGGDEAHGAAVDGAGNLYVAGAIETSTASDNIWIRKYSSTGTKLWTRTVDGPANDFDEAIDAAVDGAGNLYVVGRLTVTGESNNIWIRKYSTTGNKLWTRTVDGPANSFDHANGATVDNDGNLFVVGHINTSSEDTNIWVRKYSSSGNKLWTRIVNGMDNGSDRAYGAAVDADGNLFVVGYTTVTNEDTNIWIRKYSSSGNKLWTRTDNGSADDTDIARDVAVDTNGAAYVVGYKRLTGDSTVVWIRKYSPSGVKRWTTTFGGPENRAYGYGIVVNDTGRVYVAGDVKKTGQWTNIWVRKYRQ